MKERERKEGNKKKEERERKERTKEGRREMKEGKSFIALVRFHSLLFPDYKTAQFGQINSQFWLGFPFLISSHWHCSIPLMFYMKDRIFMKISSI